MIEEKLILHQPQTQEIVANLPDAGAARPSQDSSENSVEHFTYGEEPTQQTNKRKKEIKELTQQLESQALQRQALPCSLQKA